MTFSVRYYLKVNLSQPRSDKQSVSSHLLNQSSSVKNSEIISFFQCPQSIFLSQEVRNSQLLPVSSVNLPQPRSEKQSVPSRVLSQSSPVRKSEIVNSFRCLQSIFF
ncbi:hypothetical protein CDAR_601841 [Caerostris darwini]|uniref:Uncharacterized protein n=1 Tax=Caerostris darwini TaxID=1538125 RepID=A0AAV4PH12_9ARAC|nr:hypothetical protein CDAR_601841 [Caerostris darwini]